MHSGLKIAERDRPGVGASGSHGFSVAGTPLIADPSGALYITAHQTLIVSDLHLEQGSAFAARRQLLPPYDTAVTLARLNRLIMTYDPKRIIALGDSFHDARAGERIAETDLSVLEAMMAGREWIWIAGNHDPDVPAGLGATLPEFELAGLIFRHEPQVANSKTDNTGEIAGHLHPAARVASQSGSVRRKCFVTDGSRCIMPAFGAYTGGLNFRNKAFAGLFGSAEIIVHVLNGDKIYAISETRCAGE